MTDYWVLIFFNLLFTSVPPIIYGVLEKDVSAETLLQLPELYRSGQRSEVSVDAAPYQQTYRMVKAGMFPASQIWTL